MFSIWLWFVSWGWLFAMIAMSAVLATQMLVAGLLGRRWGALRTLGALAVIVLTFHVWEEWVIPGGFHYIYNIASEPTLRNRYPMSELTDMITNLGGAVLWFVLVELDRYGRGMGFAVMLFSYFEFTVHNYLAWSSMSLLYAQGIYTGFYAPGLITAVLMWLPLGVAHTVYFVREGLHWKNALAGLALLIVLSQALVTMPESLLKRVDNPYGFSNAGWYEQYLGSLGKTDGGV